MHLTTSLPFPHLTFKHWALDDREVAVVIVKGTFGINPDGGLGVTQDQPPIVEVDAFWGVENASSLRAEQELAPAKPCTDVTVKAIARAPEGEALADWPVSVEVEGRAFYGFHVRGPTEWRKARGKWKLSAPEPVTEVPIRYELAYGGSAPTEDGPQFHDFNPVGRGFVTDQLLQQDNPNLCRFRGLWTVPSRIGVLAEGSIPLWQSRKIVPCCERDHADCRNQGVGASQPLQFSLPDRFRPQPF